MSVFKEYFVDTLKNRYAKFDGRARRSEYWYFTLFYLLSMFAFVLVAILIVGGIENLDSGSGLSAIPLLLIGVFWLGMFIPSLAVSVRRLHDTGKSGWWLLLNFVPIVSAVGWIVILVFMCTEGDHRPNLYGPNPKALNSGTASASDHLIGNFD